MPKILLDVSHVRQHAESDCLPACAQMVLGYLQRRVSYERLRRLLGTRWFGTPAENILHLSQLRVRVELAELSLSDIVEHLQNNRPVIAFVSTADLPYWLISTDHAVVVTGVDDEVFYLHDPYFTDAPRAVSHASLELAMLRFDNRCAVIQV